MNSKRLYLGLVSAISLLGVALIAGAFILSNVLGGQSKTLADQRQQLAVLDGQQTGLTRAKADIKKYQALGTIAKSIVPEDKNQAQTIGEIVKLANQYDVHLGSFVFPGSSLGNTTGPQTKPALSQLTPVSGIPGVYSLQITVQSDSQQLVPYSNFLRFLKALEQNRRTSQVSGITISPDSTDPSVISFTLTLLEYIKP